MKYKKLKSHLFVLSLATVLTVVLTWPLLPNITSFYSDAGDYPLNGAVLWYNFDSIKTGRIFHPKEYWQGFQFYPHPFSLAFANNPVAAQIFFAPIYLISHNLPLAVNAYAMLTFVLSFLAAFYTIKYFLGDRGNMGNQGNLGKFLAALVGAAIFSFNPQSFAHFPQHIDVLNRYFLPLLFLFAYRFFDKPSWKNALLLGLFFTLNALTHTYYPIFALIMLPVVAIPFLISHLKKGDWGYLGKLGKYGLVGVIFLPILLYFNLPLWEFSQKEEATRSIAETEFFAARFIDYIGTSPDSFLYGGLMKAIFPLRSPIDDRGILNYEEHTLGLNVLPVILFIIGFSAFRKFFTGSSRWYFYILLFVPFLFTFGPYFPPFTWVFDLIPIMKGIRSPTRFEFLMYIPFSLICSFGAWQLVKKRGLPAGRQGIWVIGVIGLIIILENFIVFKFDSRSQMLEQAQKLPEETKVLLNGAPTLHLPIYTTDDADIFGKNSAYLNWLTQTGERVVNGNSSYLPADQLMFLAEVNAKLDEEALKKLKALGVRFVIVHNLQPEIQIIDLSKYDVNLSFCNFDQDLIFKETEIDGVSTLIVTNQKECYLPNIYSDRYRKVNGKIFKFPILIGPGERVVLSEIGKELRIE